MHSKSRLDGVGLQFDMNRVVGMAYSTFTFAPNAG
jgi:hypothetical protein